jgi:hypothetical protein
MYELASEAKESDWKRGSTHKSDDKRVRSARGGPEMELAPIWDTVRSIRQNGDRSPASSLGQELSLMPAQDRALSLLSLQRTHGNRYVHGLIAQAKLRAGQASDRYEQEADLVADRIMKMPGPNLQRQLRPEGIDQGSALASQITVLAPGRIG